MLNIWQEERGEKKTAKQPIKRSYTTLLKNKQKNQTEVN